MLCLPFTKIESPREAVRQFTPDWFTATMGTGILALALNQFPVAVPGLNGVAEGLWLFNIGLFVLFAIMYLARCIWFFDAAIPIVRHPVAGMFWGATPWAWRPFSTGFWCLVLTGSAAALWRSRMLRQGLPFNMGWWGFTFPIGVYSVATLTLAQQTGLHVFTILGGALVVVLALFWLIVTGRTLHGAYHGYLFVAPCLSSETGHMDSSEAAADP